METNNYHLQSSHLSSGNSSLLLRGSDDGFDGVIFDARRMKEPIDDYVNVTFQIFDVIILKITYVCGTINTLDFFWWV